MGWWVIKVVVYDVFSGESALGNPCGVVILDEWLSDRELLKLNQDIGQPVTSFVTELDGEFHIRWFSLESEINLCGHGSLAAGASILTEYQLQEVTLKSRYGEVVISKRNNLYSIVLPAWEAQRCAVPQEIADIANEAQEVFSTRDLVVVLPTEKSVAEFVPDFEQIEKIAGYHAFIVTAQSGARGYVLRYFAPKIGIAEDLATGSAQCSLAPYWFGKLNSQALTARQLSNSGGCFNVEKESDSSVRILAQVRPREKAIKRTI